MARPESERSPASNAAVTVRRALTSDLDAVESLAHSLATSFTFDERAFRASFSRLIVRDDARLLVSCDDHRTVDGYLLGFTHDSFFANGPVAWIEEMFVIDSRRRFGVGRALAEEFEAWARDRDAALIALATRRAAPFYSALGYEESASYWRKLL